MKRNRLWNVLLAVLILGAAQNELQAQTPTVSGTINDYFLVLSIKDFGRMIVLQKTTSGPTVSVGDRLLLIQHQGAGSRQEECNTYGEVNDYSAAGNFEIAVVKSVVDNGSYYVELEEAVALYYYAQQAISSAEVALPFPRGTYYGVQAVVIPYYEGDVEVAGNLTADAWDGFTGGVVALMATGTVTLKADIDVSEGGFHGGDPSAVNTSVDKTDYVYTPNAPAPPHSFVDHFAGHKGEGITGILNSGVGTAVPVTSGRYDFENSAGRGAIANGGGGGNAKNAGGGGGGNYGAGGRGGDQNSAEYDANNLQEIGGEGGWSLRYKEEAEEGRTQVFFGGGGGGGHRSNDNAGTSSDSKGGTGGGFVLILANTLKIDNTTRYIRANGADGADADIGANGAGGGGAGGVVLLDVEHVEVTGNPGSPVIVEVKGGAGGNTTGGADDTGPGGGGGGGVIWSRSSGPLLPTGVWMGTGGALVTDGIEGGEAGESNVTTVHGAGDGEIGKVLFNLTYPKQYKTGENPI